MEPTGGSRENATSTATAESQSINPGTVENAFMVFVNERRQSRNQQSLTAGCAANRTVISSTSVAWDAEIEKTWTNGTVTIDSAAGLGRYLAKHWLNINATRNLLMESGNETVDLGLNMRQNDVEAELENCQG